ncbi:hypothetical protein NXX09_04575 [Bacteroides uniformis]|nr:hypothetical protein [Bacteroides uniformis]
MKKILFILTVSVSLICFSSCKKSAATHPFPGKFVTETGIQFDLRADSTTLIQYDDSVRTRVHGKSIIKEIH